MREQQQKSSKRGKKKFEEKIIRWRPFIYPFDEERWTKDEKDGTWSQSYAKKTF